MTVYMVRNLATSEYSKGGTPPIWGEKRDAKVWTSRGALVRHILAWRDYVVMMHEDPDISSLYIEEYDVSTPTVFTKIGAFPLDKLPHSKKRLAELENGPRKTWTSIGESS